MRSPEEGHTMKEYTFVSKNKGDVTFTVVGEYVDGCKDLALTVENPGGPELYREFDEIDGGSAEEMFVWLIDNGVEFEALRSLRCNVNIVAAVLLDGDSTVERELDKAASWTDEDLKAWRAISL